jgi:putative transposase
MYYAYKYHLLPSDAHREELDRHRDICRQLYNHALYRLNEYQKDHDELPSMTTIRAELPDLKEGWDDLSDVYSKVLQTVVERLFDNLSSLSALKENGYNVGALRWKSPRNFRSFTYNQSGFKLDKKGGQTVLSLSKLAEIPIQLHRDIPDDTALKQVTLKKEPTGEWFATFGVEFDRDSPAKPKNPDDVDGIDVGILKFAHDTDGTAVRSFDLSAEREQRTLSRKEHGSNNWEKQRRIVAECYQHITRKSRDFLHNLSNYYAREYDLVAVEDLNIRGMLESPSNSRRTASAAWGTFFTMLQYKCEQEGTYFVPVDPKDTTKQCANCGVKTHKPLWVREHSCPACDYEEDRDGNAAINILSKGLAKLGVEHSEETPVETALPVDTVVSAKRVIETGSPTHNV